MPRIGKWRSEEAIRRASARAGAALAAAFAVMGTAVFVVAGCFLSDKQVCPPGTEIEGVYVGGMTGSEAERLIAEAGEKKAKDYVCTIRLPCEDDKTAVFTGNEFSAEADIAAAVSSALAGESGGIPLRFDEGAVLRQMRLLAVSAQRPPVQPSVGFSKERASAGERFWRVPGADGCELDCAECVRRIVSGQTSFDAPMTLVPYDTAPELPLPELIGEFETSFAGAALGTEQRVANIEKAAELINGTVVPPWGTFSCNAVLGRRTEANGWKLAPGITQRGAGTEDQPGGGVCQASGTLFNAALLADMTIVYRQAHSRPISYCEPGRDAAIDTDSIDLVWKNPTASPVYVFMWADKNLQTLRCEIFGERERTDRICVETELVKTVDPTPDEIVFDDSLSPWETAELNPAITGYVYRTYRVRTSQDGKTEREFIGESVYRMHPRRIAAGEKAYEKLTGAAP